jgi:hypothetical protein
LLLPAIRLGQGGNDRSIRFSLLFTVAVTTVRQHHLAAFAAVEADRDADDDRVATDIVLWHETS